LETYIDEFAKYIAGYIENMKRSNNGKITDSRNSRAGLGQN
jgi:hypothetical protein